MVYDGGMLRRKTKPIPVRLDDRTRARLNNAAKRLGSNASSIIRFSIYNQLPQIEAGRILLTPEISNQ